MTKGYIIYRMTAGRIRHILLRRKARNHENKTMSGLRNFRRAFENEAVVLCMGCSREIKPDDFVLSKVRTGDTAYSTRRHYHESCARQKNII